MGLYLLGRIKVEQLLALESDRIAQERDELNSRAEIDVATEAEIAAEQVIARAR